MMRMSEMRDRITIQKNTPSSGPIVALGGNWVDYKTLWAKVEYLKGREYFAAQAVNAETTVKFIVRYRKDIDTTMRVFFNAKNYEITGVMPLDNSRKWTIIHAKEVIQSE